MLTLTVIQGHTFVSNFTTFNLQYLRQYFSYYIQTWHDGRRMHDIYGHARFDDLELDLDFENVCKSCSSCSFFAKLCLVLQKYTPYILFISGNIHVIYARFSPYFPVDTLVV